MKRNQLDRRAAVVGEKGENRNEGQALIAHDLGIRENLHAVTSAHGGRFRDFLFAWPQFSVYNSLVQFRWNGWNLDHIEKHGMTAADAEFIAEHARRPYPEMIGDGKRYVAGQTADGRYGQVIYILDSDRTVFVIHARPLDHSEKRKFRRRTR